MLKKKYVIVMLLVLTGTVFAESPIIPKKGDWLVTPGIIYQNYDRFWSAGNKGNVPFAEEVHYYAFFVNAQYGVIDDFAVDLNAGYLLSDLQNGLLGGETDGTIDTQMGIRWNFLDENEAESPYAPSLTFRLGGVVQGSYEESIPHAPGDGASAMEGSLIFGKIFGETGFGLFGDVGYRYRFNEPPDEFFGSFGAFQFLSPQFMFSLAYKHTQALHGLDFGVPPFTPLRFPELEDIKHNIEAGATYIDKSGRRYTFLYERTLDGRNVPELNQYTFAVSFSF